MIKNLSIILFIICSCCSCAKSDHENALAQYDLAQTYITGSGGEQNYEKAVEYLKQAGNLGYAKGKNDLALLLEEGKGVPKDAEGAFCTMQEAAKSGYVESLYHMGRYYENGFGTEENLELAERYYKMAVDKKFYQAQKHLDAIKVKRRRHFEAIAPRNIVSRDQVGIIVEWSIFYKKIKILCKIDQIKILDIMVNKGNVDMSEARKSLPIVLSYGNEYSAIIPSDKSTMRIDVITDKGLIKYEK